MTFGVACLLCTLILPVAAATGKSIASINLCTDQLAILLADPEQILSLSNLSHQKAGSYHYLQARKFPTNEGYAEQILPLKPDLVLAGPYTAPHTLRQLQELGISVEVVAIADSIDSLIDNIKTVAGLISQPARGRAVIRDVRKRLSLLDRRVDYRPLAAIYDPNGYTVGADTLRGQLMQLAGWENLATRAGIERYGSLSLESLVRHAPDALIESQYSEGTYSRGQSLTQHPAIRKAGLNPTIIQVPSRMTICAGPWMIDVIEQLQLVRKKLSATKP